MSNATRIKCQWENGIQRFYVDSTDETVQAMAPLWFKEDFLGEGGLELGNTVDRWEKVEVGSGTVGLLADTASGVMNLHIANTTEAEDAVLYWGDQTSIDVLNDVQFECRLAVVGTTAAAVTAVWGMCGDHNLDKDTVAEAAWFRLQGSNVLVCETDDGTASELNDQATGLTLVTAVYHIYRIDFSDLSDVKFFVDGARVAKTSVFDLNDLTTTTGLMQPYFSLDKASAAGTADLYLDYVSMWGTRSSLVSNS